MPEQLGPYLLEKRIGAGGMADVFLARGPGGVCVVKRPHAHLCASAEFVRMFLDEASLLAQLHHPSIAQIFDLGQHHGVYYLAMEYVPGFDLMTVSLEHERQGEYMAPELAARVVSEAAGALHYAHEAVGANGQPLHLIHRDVTPHNILVSTRGEVKLIDFGVARAARTLHRTQAGLVKGKYPYMSPEQVAGGVIDRRVDVYALGLVLYELLTNARAIAGDLEVQQIDNARTGKIKPVEQLRPNVPQRLKEILGKALQVLPDDRTPTAAALQAQLEEYIHAERHVVGREDLVRLFRVVAAEATHVPEEYAPPAAAIPRASGDFPDTQHSHADTSAHPTEQSVELAPYPRTSPVPVVPIPLVTRLPTGVVPAGPSLLPPPPGILGARLEHVTEEAVPKPAPPIQLTAPVSVPPPAPAPRPAPKRSSVLPLVLALGVLGSVAAAFAFWPRPAPLPPPVKVEAPPPIAAVEPPVKVEVPPPVVVEPVKPPEPAPVAVETPDAAGVAAGTDLPPVPLPVHPASLHITSEPPMSISVDGKSRGVSPVDVEVPPGKHRVQFQHFEQHLLRVVGVKVGSGERQPVSWVPQMGTLVMSIEGFGEVRIDGEHIQTGYNSLNKHVVEGRHQVDIISADPALKKTLTRMVEIQPGQETRLNVNLLTEAK